MSGRSPIRPAALPLAAGALFLLGACAGWRSQPPDVPPAPEPARFELLGGVSLPPGATFEDTRVGGLSGITYDRDRRLFYAISDDPKNFGPPRFYTLEIDLGEGRLGEDGVRITSVTQILDTDGAPFEEIVDGEGIAWAGDTLYVSSEGHADTLVMPFVRRFSLGGEPRGELSLPPAALPRDARDAGVRHNLAYESLTLSADGGTLFTATENAWLQDGEKADLDRGSTVRILRYDLARGELVAAYAYEVDPVADPPASADDFRVNGLVDLLAFSDDRLLALERSFSAGVGNQVRLYWVDLSRAADVREVNALAGEQGPARAAKELALDLGTLGIGLDNLEGLTFGPTLTDGRRTLVLVSDNNFNDERQKTQFLAFALNPAQ